MKTQVLTNVGLSQYDELIKNYIEEKMNELDNDNTPNEVFSSTEPEAQNDGDIWTKLID